MPTKRPFRGKNIRRRVDWRTVDATTDSDIAAHIAANADTTPRQAETDTRTPFEMVWICR